MTNLELEQFILENQKAIYSFCRQLTHNTEEAEDLYQDTFLKAFELDKNMKLEQNPKSYLLSIAIRLWKNKKRKYAWRRRIAEEKLLLEEEGEVEVLYKKQLPEAQVIDNEQREIVLQLVNALPEKLRLTVLLFYMEEMSVVQIADVMKIPKGTVKSRLYKARKLLEKSLQQNGIDTWL
ncbi:MAG: RNA polymerase sigma factor [Lachnospiraceae bacterium]|nr:RNA polymerase sigma factor [Lachnospiraceae bacterium]